MSYEPYRLQEMTGERALRILGELVAELSEIELSEMTTFELNIIRLCANNPPDYKGLGIEEKLVQK